MRVRSARLGFYPSEAALRLIDDCARDLAPEGGALLKWHAEYLADHRVRIALDLDLVKQIVPVTHTVLEFGSVPLLLTSALVRSGYQVTGCDIAPERYASTLRSTGMKVVKCDIETQQLPFADDSFDAAIFNELFEHLRINPNFTLSEVLRVLKPNGVLTLSSPNLKSLGGIRNFMIRDQAYSCSGDIHAEYNKLSDIGHMGHVREYTPTEIGGFLQAVGFEMSSVLFRGEYAGTFARALIRLVPRLSPFASYIAKKPGNS